MRAEAEAEAEAEAKVKSFRRRDALASPFPPLRSSFDMFGNLPSSLQIWTIKTRTAK